jgi:hypothetical protein
MQTNISLQKAKDDLSVYNQYHLEIKITSAIDKRDIIIELEKAIQDVREMVMVQ